MKRRPKLSLSPGNNVDKKQAPGFEPAASDRARTAPDPAPPPPQPPPVQRPSNDQAARPNPAQTPPEPPPVQRPGNDQAARPKPVWARPAVKALLIVAATALSLYLLKRRFF